MTLPTWLENRWLVEHQPSAEEIADLIAVVDRDLRDAAVDRLSADWRLGIAYNAALQLAHLALAAERYRPERNRAHERAIQSLRLTVGVEQERVDLLDAVRRKRNTSNYERAGTASDAEALEVYELATHLRTEVLEWMDLTHPDLMTYGWDPTIRARD